MTHPPRRIDADQLPIINNQIPQEALDAVQAMLTEPGQWHVFAGPYAGYLARIRAS